MTGAAPHGGRPLVFAVAVAAGVSLVFVPVLRAVLAAAAIIAVAWVVLLPRGWFPADRRVRRLILAFVAVRLAMPFVAESIGGLADVLFTGGSDAFSYHAYGTRVAHDLAQFGHSLSHRRAPGTGTIDLAVGYFYLWTAPVRLVTYYLWGGLATVAMLLFWAFTNHLAGPRRVGYTAFVLFTPTLLFWNAGLSKEAPITFAVACLVAGVQTISIRGTTVRAAFYLAVGVAVAGVVRPHIALLLTVSAVIAFLVSSGEARARIGRRVVGVGIAVSCVVILVPLTSRLIDPAGQQSFIDAAQSTAERTADVGGRSAFEASPTTSIAQVPGAVATVLFRPWPWEVRTVPQALASAEALVIGFLVTRAAWAFARRRVRFERSVLVPIAAVYSFLFCIAFSSLGNFGLLVRERMQVVPFLLLITFAARPLRPVGGTAPAFPRQGATSWRSTVILGNRGRVP